MKRNLVHILAKRIVSAETAYNTLTPEQQDRVRGIAWKEAAGWIRRWQWRLLVWMYAVCVVTLILVCYVGFDIAPVPATVGSFLVAIAVMIFLAEWGIVETAVQSAQYAMFWRRVAHHINAIHLRD